MLRGQNAADNGEFDQAAVAALEAHGVCGEDAAANLEGLDGRVAAGKAMAQVCSVAVTQAREQMRAGKPAAAEKLLAPAHDRCAAWPGFPELEALPANARAQAQQMVERIPPLIKSGAWDEAGSLAAQAAALDAESAGLPELQAQLAKHLGTAPAAGAGSAARSRPATERARRRSGHGCSGTRRGRQGQGRAGKAAPGQARTGKGPQGRGKARGRGRERGETGCRRAHACHARGAGCPRAAAATRERRSRQRGRRHQRAATALPAAGPAREAERRSDGGLHRQFRWLRWATCASSRPGPAACSTAAS
jgi:hypothetical protein